MTTTTTAETFEVGTTYTTRFIGDAQSILRYRVVRRSARFVTVQDITHGDGEQPVRIGIKVDREGEWALPMGSYAMAPVLRAGRREDDR